MLSPEALRELSDNEPSVFCTWEFYEYEIQSTPVSKGPVWVGDWVEPTQQNYISINAQSLNLHSNMISQSLLNLWIYTTKWYLNHCPIFESIQQHEFSISAQSLNLYSSVSSVRAQSLKLYSSMASHSVPNVVMYTAGSGIINASGAIHKPESA